MAGDWIKIEHALPDKPEVFQISEILGIDPDEVAGKLIRLWAWADQNSVNGCGIVATFAQLNRITFRNGFAEALQKVGWLTGESGNLTLNNFERHNGKTAKMRAESARRMAKTRRERDLGCCVNVAEKAQQKAQPEKRREDKRERDAARADYHPEAERRVEALLGTPTLELALAFGKENAITPDCAEKWFWSHDAENWQDKFGKPLANWRSSLRGYWVSWAENSRREASRIKPGQPVKQKSDFIGG